MYRKPDVAQINCQTAIMTLQKFSSGSF